VADFELLSYAASRAYERRTGKRLPTAAYHRQRPADPVGAGWQEDDLGGLFPALAARFDGQQ